MKIVEDLREIAKKRSCSLAHMKSECYDKAFRKKIYRAIEELQLDVDHWLKYYNNDRPHSGKYCYGKTPIETFTNSKHLSLEKNNEMLYNQEVTDRTVISDKMLVDTVLK